MKTLHTIVIGLSLLFYYNTKAQSIPQIAATLEIDTILNNGPKDNRINFAFANVTNPENTGAYESKSELRTDLDFILRHFDPRDRRGRSGFSQYRDFFNIYSVWFPEPLVFEQKPSYYQTAQGIRDHLFLPWATDDYGWITMMYTFRDGGGGGAGLTRERRVGDALIFGLEWETVLHEFNHTMPGVLDEYTASGEWSNYQCLEGPNTTGGLVLEDVPWRKWIDADTPIPTPYTQEYFDKTGVFEGTISGYFGCHRPTARGCYMGAGGFGENYGQEMCVVCLQRFICMMYQYVDVIEDVSPSNTQLSVDGKEQMTFSANMVKPIPNTQLYEWFLNGKLIAKNVESVDVEFESCSQYELTLVVTDTTAHVRYDEKFADRYPEPKQSHTWYINQSDVNNYNLDFQLTSSNTDCTGPETGAINIAANGGLAPYEYYLNQAEVSNAIGELAAGTYEVNVVDANGCALSKAIEIQANPALDFEINMDQGQGVAVLSPRLFSAWEGNLSYEWSSGEQSEEIQITQSGQYTLNITTADGCIVQRSIEIALPEMALSTQHSLVQSSSTSDNGAIYLDINGGKTPYDIIWYQGESVDLTQPNSGIVISSGNGELERHLPSFAFDDIVQYDVDFWAEGFRGNNFIGYDFGQATTVESYSITSNVDVPERDAKDWKLQGSNDGNSWTTIEEKQNYNFPFRLQKDNFFLDAPATYRFFRLLVTANHGDNWVAIQEVEFGGIQYEEIKENRGQTDLVDLGPGFYRYEVIDDNQSLKTAKLKVADQTIASHDPIEVVQLGRSKVAIESPNPAFTYYWLAEADGTGLLHQGVDFSPPASGNYYVKAFQTDVQAFRDGIKGFAVSLEEMPQVVANENGLSVVNPRADVDYFWYNEETGETALAMGSTYVPNEMGTYYVGAVKKASGITEIDPLNVPGISLWMDASDINADGQTDEGLENSSAYEWEFKQGGFWGGGSWFPYRTNYQNGLGVVDFATVWFQGFQGGTDRLRTIIMAYEENDLSFPESAPIYGLVENIPRHKDASQLFSDNAPSRVLNGRTYLNGELVNPLNTANPLEFMLLSVVMSSNASNFTGATHEFWEGKVGEIIIWDRALSPGQVQGINEFLKKKWLSIADLESQRSEVQWLLTSTKDLQKTEWKIFPNPTKGTFYIQSAKLGDQAIFLSDLSGRVLWEGQLRNQLQEVDISAYQNGTYFITIQDKDTGYISHQKIMKVK